MTKLESLSALWEIAGHSASSIKQSEVIAFCQRINQEIDSRYMLLPVDADGVPIHVGDSIEYPNGRRDIVRFITVNDNVPTFNEKGWIASKCRHVKPRTVEDVLREFAQDIRLESIEKSPLSDEAIAKYAAELQMRGDAE